MNTRTITAFKPLRLKNGHKTVMAKKPEKKAYKLYINQRIDECGDGWDFFRDDEYYKNIIVYGNREMNTINEGDFSDLYDDIIHYADDAMNEIEDCEIGGAAYNSMYYSPTYHNQTEALQAYFEHSSEIKITPYITGQFKKIMRTTSDDEQIAKLMTLFTPYTWEWSTIRGYSQSDWNYILYPVELYVRDDIKTFEAFYMGKYMDYAFTYKGETVRVFITDDEAYDERNIYSSACDCFCLKPEEVEIIYHSY